MNELGVIKKADYKSDCHSHCQKLSSGETHHWITCANYKRVAWPEPKADDLSKGIHQDNMRLRVQNKELYDALKFISCAIVDSDDHKTTLNVCVRTAAVAVAKYKL